MYVAPQSNALRDWLAEQGGGRDLLSRTATPITGLATYLHHSFPVAEAFAQTCISLPIGSHLTLSQIDEVIELIQCFLK